MSEMVLDYRRYKDMFDSTRVALQNEHNVVILTNFPENRDSFKKAISDIQDFFEKRAPHGNTPFMEKIKKFIDNKYSDEATKYRVYDDFLDLVTSVRNQFWKEDDNYFLGTTLISHNIPCMYPDIPKLSAEWDKAANLGEQEKCFQKIVRAFKVSDSQNKGCIDEFRKEKTL